MPKVQIAKSVGRGGVNNPDDVIVVKKRLIELGFDWLTPDSQVGPLMIETIQLFQAIKNGSDMVKTLQNDGLINVNQATHKWLQAKNAPRWQMMSAGSKAAGYVNFEINDLSDNHDFGTKWLDETIKATGANYRDTFLANNPNAALFTVNDASRPRGGDTPDHSGHETGLVCDVRLPRKDGDTGNITFSSSSYHRVAAREMIKAFRRQPLFETVFFNDPQLIQEGLCRHASKHNDHIHFEIQPPIIEPDV